jgi:hypothetical protein
MDPVVAAVLRGGLALLLVIAAGHKARALDRFRATLADYRLLPARAVPLAATLVVGVEVGIALALVLSASRTAGPLLAAALLAVYTLAIAINLARGRRDIDCGCGGPALHQPLGGRLVVRNAVLIAAALAAVLPLRSRAITAVDALTVVAGTIALAALSAAADRLMANVARLPERA